MSQEHFELHSITILEFENLLIMKCGDTNNFQDNVCQLAKCHPQSSLVHLLQLKVAYVSSERVKC